MNDQKNAPAEAPPKAPTAPKAYPLPSMIPIAIGKQPVFAASERK